MDSQGFQAGLTYIIFRSLERVTVTVNFHGQHQFEAEEVYDISVNGFLAVKVAVVSLASLQVSPEQGFGKRAVIPQVPGQLAQGGIIREFHAGIFADSGVGARTHPAPAGHPS